MLLAGLFGQIQDRLLNGMPEHHITMQRMIQQVGRQKLVGRTFDQIEHPLVGEDDADYRMEVFLGEDAADRSGDTPHHFPLVIQDR